MKDANDVKTGELLPVKRGRGRPRTGEAKTNAERQKTYRARRKWNFDNISLRVTLNTDEQKTLSMALIAIEAKEREFDDERADKTKALYKKLFGYEM